MSDFDAVIRGGTLVTSANVRSAEIGIADGRLRLLKSGEKASAREVVDASGLHIFPGLIDSHVHFNDPGRADWEGIETGSRALAAGGGTMFVDMPLNAHPPTIDAESFDLKRRAAEASSLVDFALWGGLVPGNVERLEELAERGVVGFKAFMSNSGIDDFERADDCTLREGMKRAAALRKIVAVHAESEEMTCELGKQAMTANRTSVRDYLNSRPIHAELEAIQRVLELAGETKCPLHIVHVSCGAGIALIASARKMGVDVTCETCPHYLVLTEDDMEGIGALAKCAPPLRPKAAQDALWEYLKAAEIDAIGSDHSPSPPSMKTDANFFKVWGGISGVQHTLPLLVTEGYVNRSVALPMLVRLLSCNVAERFGFERKGDVVDGGDADLALVDFNSVTAVTADALHYRHKHSPYVGRSLKGKVVRTILRGETIYKNGEFVSKPLGRFIKPTKSGLR